MLKLLLALVVLAAAALAHALHSACRATPDRNSDFGLEH